MLRRHLLYIVFAMMLIVSLAGSLAAKEITREFTFDDDRLRVANMIGEVEIREGSGDQFRVTVHVRGGDAGDGVLEFVEEHKDGDVLIIKFPVDKHRKYVYPGMGRDSRTSIHYSGQKNEGGSWLRKVLGGDGDKITVRGKGSGLEVWADVVIETPADGELEVKHGVGSISANAVRVDLDLDTHSGPIEVAGVQGDLRADTGSGSVTATDIDGEVNIDTGSGSVQLSDCRGRQVLVDTGSGRVVAERIRCDRLHIDTGSGSVRARAVACDRAKIDTGSGSVELELDRMGDGRFVIDTGSGGVELILPADASARIVADTGSGGVRNKVQGAMVEHMDRDEMKLVIGDGAAQVILDTGSGSITVSQK